jgi:hypothetical protein
MQQQQRKVVHDRSVGETDSAQSVLSVRKAITQPEQLPPGQHPLVLLSANDIATRVIADSNEFPRNVPLGSVIFQIANFEGNQYLLIPPTETNMFETIQNKIRSLHPRPHEVMDSQAIEVTAPFSNRLISLNVNDKTLTPKFIERLKRQMPAGTDLEKTPVKLAFYAPRQMPLRDTRGKRMLPVRELPDAELSGKKMLPMRELLDAESFKQIQKAAFLSTTDIVQKFDGQHRHPRKQQVNSAVNADLAKQIKADLRKQTKADLAKQIKALDDIIGPLLNEMDNRDASKDISESVMDRIAELLETAATTPEDGMSPEAVSQLEFARSLFSRSVLNAWLKSKLLLKDNSLASKKYGAKLLRIVMYLLEQEDHIQDLFAKATKDDESSVDAEDVAFALRRREVVNMDVDQGQGDVDQGHEINLFWATCSECKRWRVLRHEISEKEASKWTCTNTTLGGGMDIRNFDDSVKFWFDELRRVRFDLTIQHTPQERESLELLQNELESNIHDIAEEDEESAIERLKEFGQVIVEENPSYIDAVRQDDDRAIALQRKQRSKGFADVSVDVVKNSRRVDVNDKLTGKSAEDTKSAHYVSLGGSANDEIDYMEDVLLQVEQEIAEHLTTLARGKIAHAQSDHSLDKEIAHAQSELKTLLAQSTKLKQLKLSRETSLPNNRAGSNELYVLEAMAELTMPVVVTPTADVSKLTSNVEAMDVDHQNEEAKVVAFPQKYVLRLTDINRFAAQIKEEANTVGPAAKIDTKSIKAHLNVEEYLFLGATDSIGSSIIPLTNGLFVPRAIVLGATDVNHIMQELNETFIDPQTATSIKAKLEQVVLDNEILPYILGGAFLKLAQFEIEQAKKEQQPASAASSASTSSTSEDKLRSDSEKMLQQHKVPKDKAERIVMAWNQHLESVENRVGASDRITLIKKRVLKPAKAMEMARVKGVVSPIMKYPWWRIFDFKVIPVDQGPPEDLDDIDDGEEEAPLEADAPLEAIASEAALTSGKRKDVGDLGDVTTPSSKKSRQEQITSSDTSPAVMQQNDQSAVTSMQSVQDSIGMMATGKRFPDKDLNPVLKKARPDNNTGTGSKSGPRLRKVPMATVPIEAKLVTHSVSPPICSNVELAELENLAKSMLPNGAPNIRELCNQRGVDKTKEILQQWAQLTLTTLSLLNVNDVAATRQISAQVMSMLLESKTNYFQIPTLIASTYKP